MAIYIPQSLILPKIFFFLFFCPPEDCSKDQHSFKTTQHISKKRCLVELQEATLQQKAAPATPVMSRSWQPWGGAGDAGCEAPPGRG